MKRQCSSISMAGSIAGITFRDLVKDCAEEPQFIESFNRAYGAQLQAPITAILDDRWPLRVAKDEEFLIGCFIMFVHENIWVRLRRAQTRTQAPAGARRAKSAPERTLS